MSSVCTILLLVVARSTSSKTHMNNNITSQDKMVKIRAKACAFFFLLHPLADHYMGKPFEYKRADPHRCTHGCAQTHYAFLGWCAHHALSVWCAHLLFFTAPLPLCFSLLLLFLNVSCLHLSLYYHLPGHICSLNKIYTKEIKYNDIK